MAKKKRGVVLPDRPSGNNALRSDVTLNNIDVRDNVELEHNVFAPNSMVKLTLPTSKTEDQIDRQWEYNLITGKYRLPKGVE